MKKIDVIVGARPNFMKVAALFAILDGFPSLKLRLIHTGQHYDEAMSGVFLKELGLPKPVCNLGVGSGSHATQTAQVMIGYEQWVNENRPDVCLVVGDVNSTVACALVAAKMQIVVAHVEAGLRSFDRTMPEELNRIVTDSLSDLLFVNEPSGVKNLMKEGVESSKVHLVGNVMIDTLLSQLEDAKKQAKYVEFGLESRQYAFVTFHRPSNVDNSIILLEIVDQLLWLSNVMPILFSVHPRTRRQLQNNKLYEVLEASSNIHLAEPLSYTDALSMTANAKVVVTDSGGLQEETSVLKVPCLTLRDNTERPITIDEGTNTLIASDWILFRKKIEEIEEGVYLKGVSNIQLWDGLAAKRILIVLDGI